MSEVHEVQNLLEDVEGLDFVDDAVGVREPLADSEILRQWSFVAGGGIGVVGGVGWGDCCVGFVVMR